MNRFLIFFLMIAGFVFFGGTNAAAQCKGDFGADKPATELKLALYGDAFKAQKYQEAKGPLQWLLINAPRISTKIYIDGVDIYDKLAGAETDPSKKQVLVDSVMAIYDLRIANCGNEEQVIGRKANAMFKFNYKDKTKLASVLEIYDRTFELNKEDMMESNLDLYMKAVQLNSVMNKGSMTDEQILERYDNINSVLDAKIKKATDAGKANEVAKLNAIRVKVDESLTATPVKFDCEMVKSKLEPKFRQNPTDQKLAKKIFTFMLQGKCTDDPLWLEAGEVIKDIEPKDFGLIKNLALKHLSNENSEKAEAFMKEAQALATKPDQKSDALTILGSIESKKGNNTGARDYFRQAATADPANKEAWSKIGDLYYNSFDDCAKRQNMAEDRLVYIAAYEMYQRGGDGQGMAKARAQFPSKEDLFLLNWKVGESRKITCWVGETVALKTRD
ncbi:MAG: tetratricopeptide repeat protein [Cyclobacteriaceae bacterium]